MYAYYFQADLHLDTFPWAKRPEFKGDAYAALEASQEVILADDTVPQENKIVIWGGDITEKSLIDDATNACMAKVIQTYTKFGITVAYINGNHDRSRKAYKDIIGHPGIHGAYHLGHGQAVTLGDKVFVGLDFRPRTKLLEDLQEVPECDFLVLHCAFKHLLGFEGAYDLEMADIPPHIKNVLVGDVHVRDVSVNLKGTRIISPGPIHPCSVDQPGPHGTMKVLSGDDTNTHFLPHTSRLVLDYTIDNEKTVDMMEKEILEEIKDHKLIPHCVMRYISDDSALAERLFERLTDKVHIHDKKTCTGHMLSAAERKEIIENIEDTSLLQEIDRYPESLGRDLVKRLLETDDPMSILTEEFNEVVAEGEKIIC